MEGSDVRRMFSVEFRKYVSDENLLCRRRRGSQTQNCSAWVFYKKEQQSDGVNSDIAAYFDLLCKMTLRTSYMYPGETCLVQFWKEEEPTLGKNCSVLTTHNQPFLISGSHYYPKDFEGFCSYRMNMVDIITRDGENGGVIGRVFQKRMMEYTPSVGYYSYEEYPHHDLAKSCHIKGSLALPLASSSGCLIGVLEVVSLHGQRLQDEILAVLWKSSSLRHLHRCKDICSQYDLQENLLHIAMSEIKEVMQVVGKSCGLVRARTWIVCNHCDSLSISKSLVDELDASYDSYGASWFLEAERLCTLKKGEGIVGKAVASSHNLVYCGDVSQFSITEYPLAHFTRHRFLSNCFAICLKSGLTGSQIYVLELFLDSWKINPNDLSATLAPILEEMKQNFRTFKLASGEEIEKNLPVQVIDARYLYKIEILKVGRQDISLPIGINNMKACKPYPLQHSVGDSSTNKTDVPMNGIDAYPLGTLGYSIAEIFMNETDDPMTRIGPYSLPHLAGESSTHKTDYPITGIGAYRLPHSVGESSTSKADDLMNEAGPYLLPHSNGEGSTQGTASSASTVQSKCWLTMNVIYGGDSFRFQLSSSSNLPELSQQVLQSLSLHEGTYNVSYLDDNDNSILIGCDEDLRDYISCSMKQDKYTLMMQIEPK